ncbi:MAG: hypothetical protein Q8O91_01210 [Candidatus Aminicenantes bacterium]|nr:hypothetical protein [Candidatus Aminicenantes bacterium]
MDERAKEIRRLKETLDKKIAEIHDLEELVNKDIDRTFPSPVEEFSEKELTTYIRECLSSIDIDLEFKPDIRAITSHRKTLGKPIVFLKRAFLETTFRSIDSFLDKQIHFNRQISALCRALLLRTSHSRERMKQIEERISGCEENLAILKNKLENLRSGPEPLKNRPTVRPLK